MKLGAYVREMILSRHRRVARTGVGVLAAIENIAGATDVALPDTAPPPTGGNQKVVDAAVVAAGFAILESVQGGRLSLANGLEKLQRLARGYTGSTGARTGAVTEDRPPTDPKAFSEWISQPDRGAVPRPVVREHRTAPGAEAAPPVDPVAFSKWASTE